MTDVDHHDHEALIAFDAAHAAEAAVIVVDDWQGRGLGSARRAAGTLVVEVEIPESGIGEHMAGVLRVAAGGTAELATPPWGLRIG